MTKLTCPHCGSTEGFSYREDQTVSWGYTVIKIVGGALRIDPDGEHSPFGDVGTGADPFIECGECGKGFPIPTGLKLNFVNPL
jgi:hypothetical protein